MTGNEISKGSKINQQYNHQVRNNETGGFSQNIFKYKRSIIVFEEVYTDGPNHVVIQANFQILIVWPMFIQYECGNSKYKVKGKQIQDHQY